VKGKPDPAHPQIVILLTNGMPTTGETDTGNIVRNIAKENHGRSWLFVFGVAPYFGSQLLDEFAHGNRATDQYVEPTEDPECCSARVSEPVLVNLELNMEEI